MNTHNSRSKGPLNPSGSFKNLGFGVTILLPKNEGWNLALSKSQCKFYYVFQWHQDFTLENSPDDFNETLANLDHGFLTMVQHFLWTHKLLEAVMALPGVDLWAGLRQLSLLPEYLRHVQVHLYLLSTEGSEQSILSPYHSFNTCKNGLTHCPVCLWLNPRWPGFQCCLFWNPFGDSTTMIPHPVHTHVYGTHTE